MVEANRRGLLPEDQKMLLEEAHRRGLLEAVSDTPTWKKGLVALGRGMTDIGQGAQQLVRSGIEALPGVPRGAAGAEDYNAKVAEELRLFKPFEETVSGSSIGRAVGAALPTLALPVGTAARGAGAVISKLAPTAGARVAGSVAADAALTGAGQGALMATDTGETHLGGAAAGAAGGVAAVGALNVAGRVATPAIRALANRINPQAPIAAGMTTGAPGMSPELTAAVIRALEKEGIDVPSLTADARARIAAMAADTVQGNPVTAKELARAARLQSLPVPIQGTKGQLSKDFAQNQLEQSLAKSTSAGAPIREAFATQDEKLIENLDKFRGQTGANIATEGDMGRSVDAALRARIKKSNANIGALYREAEKTGETLAPVDAQPLVDWLAANESNAVAAPAIDAIKNNLLKIGAIEVDKAGAIIAKASRPQTAPESISQAVRKIGGLKRAERPDITGGHKGNDTLFTKDGIAIDQMVPRLRERGFDINEMDVDGGVQQLRDMLADEISGRAKHFPIGSEGARARTGVPDEAAFQDIMRQYNTASSENSKAFNFNDKDPGFISEQKWLDDWRDAQVQALKAASKPQNVLGIEPRKFVAKPVTINDLENIRKAAVNLGDASSNGHYMSEVKKVIDGMTEGVGGEAYQAARSARLQHALQFEEPGVIQNVVGMKSRTDRAVPFEDVFKKTVINGSIDDLKLLKRTLIANDPATREAGVQALKDMRGQAIQYLKDAATNNAYETTSEAALRRAYNQIGPEKMQELFGGNVAKQFANFLEAVKDLKVPPKGTFNPSGTAGELVNWVDRILGFVPGGGIVKAGVKGAAKLAESAKASGQAAAAVNPIDPAANASATLAQQNERVRALLDSPTARKLKGRAAALIAAGAAGQ
jgi:hypothetical protein